MVCTLAQAPIGSLDRVWLPTADTLALWDMASLLHPDLPGHPSWLAKEDLDPHFPLDEIQQYFVASPVQSVTLCSVLK